MTMLKQLTNFHKISYECYGIVDHSNTKLFNFLQSVISGRVNLWGESDSSIT
jgi:hypothetical protein